jgi:hypothetical protein
MYNRTTLLTGEVTREARPESTSSLITPPPGAQTNLENEEMEKKRTRTVTKKTHAEPQGRHYQGRRPKLEAGHDTAIERPPSHSDAPESKNSKPVKGWGMPVPRQNPDPTAHRRGVRRVPTDCERDAADFKSAHLFIACAPSSGEEPWAWVLRL